MGRDLGWCKIARVLRATRDAQKRRTRVLEVSCRARREQHAAGGPRVLAPLLAPLTLFRQPSALHTCSDRARPAGFVQPRHGAMAEMRRWVGSGRPPTVRTVRRLRAGSRSLMQPSVERAARRQLSASYLTSRTLPCSHGVHRGTATGRLHRAWIGERVDSACATASPRPRRPAPTSGSGCSGPDMAPALHCAALVPLDTLVHNCPASLAPAGCAPRAPCAPPGWRPAPTSNLRCSPAGPGAPGVLYCSAGAPDPGSGTCHSATDWSREPVTRCRSLTQAMPNTQSWWPCGAAGEGGRVTCAGADGRCAPHM